MSGALAAALLSERDPLLRGITHRSTTPSDLLDRVEVLEEWARGERNSSRMNESAVEFVLRARDQLIHLLPARRASDGLADEEFLRSLLAAFPDRLARRREVAKLRQAAVVENVDYRTSRGRSRSVPSTHNVPMGQRSSASDLVDSTGRGKSWLARAQGMPRGIPSALQTRASSLG